MGAISASLPVWTGPRTPCIMAAERTRKGWISVKKRLLSPFSALALTLCLLAVTVSCGAPPATSPPPLSHDGGSAPPVPTPSPTPVPTPTPEPAMRLLSSMSTWEKVCQLFVVLPESLTAPGTGTGGEPHSTPDTYPVGGLLLNAGHLTGREQTVTMLAAWQARSPIPLLTCADQEGGRVRRLDAIPEVPQHGAMFGYRTLGPETAYANASATAEAMLALGLNTNLAPVADVWSAPVNTVIGDRAYSDDFTQAAELIPAAVRGFREHGLICTLKHFPGHGDSLEDSHYTSAYIYKDLETLRTQELLPFAAGIAAGADMVMTGHLIVPALDEAPATFSHAIVTGLLREELGFSGVVITDSLSMAAVTGHADTGELCVLALEAGCDLLLDPVNLADGIQGILDALESGRLSEERLDESVLRILRLKCDRLGFSVQNF